MKSRTRLAAGAALLLALLAGLVAVARLAFDRPAERARAAAEQAGKALPFRPADATAVVIAPRAGAPVRLAWSIADGDAHARASSPPDRALFALLGRLAAVRVVSRRPADPAALATAGLSPPASRVTVELRDGSSLSLDVGDEIPFDRSRFARRGDEVLVVTALPPEALDPEPLRHPVGPEGG